MDGWTNPPKDENYIPMDILHKPGGIKSHYDFLLTPFCMNSLCPWNVSVCVWFICTNKWRFELKTDTSKYLISKNTVWTQFPFYLHFNSCYLNLLISQNKPENLLWDISSLEQILTLRYRKITVCKSGCWHKSKKQSYFFSLWMSPFQKVLPTTYGLTLKASNKKLQKTTF